MRVALLAATLALGACGARRAAPTPAFPEPLAAEVTELRVQADRVRATVVVHSRTRAAWRVVGLDWTTDPQGLLGQSQDLDLSLVPGGRVRLPLDAPLAPAAGGPTVLAGSVSLVGALGAREVLSFEAPVPPP